MLIVPLNVQASCSAILPADLDQFLRNNFSKQVRGRANNLRDKLGALLRQLKWKLHADAITFFLYDERRYQFDLPIAFGLAYPTAFFDPAMWPGTDRAIGRLLKDLVPMDPFMPDQLSAIAGPFMDREDILYSAAFPIAYRNKPLGVVFFNYRRSCSLTDNERQIITGTIEHAAREIWTHRGVRDVHRNAPKRIARAVCKQIMQTLNNPVAIWRYVSGSKLSLWGAAGVPETSLIKRIEIDNTRESWFENVTNVSVAKDRGPVIDPHISFMRLSDEASICPIRHDSLPVGLMVIFRGRGNSGCIDPSGLSHPLGVAAGALLQHSLIARWFVQAGKDLAGRLQSNVAIVMTRAVEEAVIFTGADSGALVIFDETTGRFSLGAMAPRQAIDYFPNSSWAMGLMLNIISRNEPYSTAGRTAEIGKKALRQKGLRDLGGTQSFVGVPVEINEKQVGVLYVCGKRRNQFLEEHVTWMQEWARHTTVALGRSRSLLNSISNVKNAIGYIENVATGQRICNIIKERFGFDFVSLHIVRQIEGIIQTVYEVA